MPTPFRRALTAAVFLSIAITSGTASAAFVNPDVVKGTSLFEGFGSGTHIGPRRLFAWTNESGRDGDAMTGFADRNNGTLTRINAPRTQAFVGGYDQGTDHVIYQQVRKRNSNLFLFDVSERTRTPLGEINDERWQWNPSIDTHRGTRWIVYGENRFRSPASKWKLYLFDGRTGERLLLDETSNRCGCLFPGTIAYPWVTWAVGADATAWRYDIRTGERAPLLPTDRDEYGVAVTPDGTAYVAQAGDRCGSSAAIYRVGLDGVPFLLWQFTSGREAANLSLDTVGAHDRLYFDRRVCSSGSSDILRLRRAELIGEPAGPATRRGTAGRAEAGSSATRSGASSGASPRNR